MTSFVGRRRERARIDELLRDGAVRWLTITGPGGVGKTRLAIETAQAFAAATGTLLVFASLVNTFSPDAMLAQLAGQLDPHASDREPLATIGRWFAGRRALLLLDNAEHLLAEGGVLSELLVAPGCEALTLLVTSRAAFDRTGEHVYPLGPLPLPPTTARAPESLGENDAARLFLARARQANADLAIEQADPRVIAEICRRLDGLPLAIELAAARTRTLSLPTLLARLDKRLPLLTNAPADADTRHRTMRDAIAWGYDLLTPDEQRLLQRLAVFSGGFSIDFARRIVAGREPGHGYPFCAGYGIPFPFAQMMDDPGVDEGATLDRALPLAPLAIDADSGVQRLVDWSLVQPSERAGDLPRYVMLETIREFALEQLEASGESEAVYHAYAALVLAFVEVSSEGSWVSSKQRWGRETIDAEMANIRTASDWLLRRGPEAADLALRITDCMTIVWQMRGMFVEGRGYLERARAQDAGSIFRRASADSALGFLNWAMGDDTRAEAAIRRGLALAELADTPVRTGILHFFLALIEWRKGPERLFEMLSELELATAAFTEWSDPVGLGVCKLALGEALRLTDDRAGAIALFDEAFALHEVGYEWGMATARYFSGEAHRELQQYALAAELTCDGLRRYWKLGDVWGAGGCICGIACIAETHGQWATAARLFGAATQMREQVNAVLPPTHQAAYEESEARVRIRTGDEPFRAGRALTPAAAVAAAAAVGERFARGDVGAARAPSIEQLTRMQRAVLELYAQGYDHAQIAEKLARGQAAVYRHTKNLLDDWGLTTYEELRDRARELGFGRAVRAESGGKGVAQENGRPKPRKS